MNRCTRMATSSYCMLRRNVSHTLTNRAILMQQLRRWYHPPPAIAADFQGLLVDLRSDTITKPTLGMKQAMMDALLGDDVYREDPTVKELERRMAIYTGKEAALFVPSGTMGNLIAVLGHCENRGCEVLLGDQAHIFLYEQAGMAQLGGVQPHIIPNRADGTFDVSEIPARVRDEDVHCPRTALVCIENTQNVCGGKVIPLSWIDEVGSIAKSIGIPLHMDGARLMNAVIASGESAPRILQACETASICLSKGLGTPVGSVIVGSEEFMYKALRLRKVLGGGMRQAGMLAAAGLYAMDNMINRLADDHRHAQQLAQAIYGMGSRSVKCSPAEVHTNIAIVHLTTDIITPEQFCKRLLVVSEEEISEIGEVAIKVLPWTSDSVRFVTHFDVSSEGIEAAVAKLKYVISEVDSQLD
ncbi:putative L-allo-threonine aldolase [Penaeus vannamei]|uniref:Putative L-allo-threonine aldolase n=1 Tax=Penaeus vannamei TaxID=6689 RepID=A0A3R7MTS9_PENVA|nr:probable low-specificity L-threonine aldolase 2 isoform X1 [Penaeus vannamei]ROT85764.1 putative L-allo-threonine aldolase [Penaeus vannamei]